MHGALGVLLTLREELLDNVAKLAALPLLDLDPSLVRFLEGVFDIERALGSVLYLLGLALLMARRGLSVEALYLGVALLRDRAFLRGFGVFEELISESEILLILL